jgi:transcriptional regulator
VHPNPHFRPPIGDLLDRAAEIGFAHLFVRAADGPRVAHVPLTRHGAQLRFHLARANPAYPHLDGARVLASLSAADAYVSPNWYERPGNQVPTWNYLTIELDGVARKLPEAELLEQLDALADRHEPRPNPWTRAKADPAAIAAMLRAIEGFALEVLEARGTTKLSQNKNAADRAGVVAGLRARGAHGMAELMEQGR